MRTLLSAICAAILICPAATASAGQMTWANVYGDEQDYEWGTYLEITDDGGYIVGGGCSVADQASGDKELDLLIVKMDNEGTPEWTMRYGIPDREDRIQSIQAARDGGYIVSAYGQCAATGDRVYYVFKTDQSGSLVWKKDFTLPDVQVWVDAVRLTEGGEYLLEGHHTHDTANQYKDYFLISLAQDGTVLWKQVTGYSNNYWTYWYRASSSGGYAGAGTGYAEANGSVDVLFRKIDINGTVQMQKSIGTKDKTEWALDTVHTSDGGYMIAGCDLVGNFGGGGEQDLMFMKLDKNGALVWQHSYGQTGAAERPVQIHRCADGGFIINGIFEESPRVWKKSITKLNAGGEIQWMKKVVNQAGTETINFNYVESTADGGCIIIGTYESAGAPSGFLLKVASDGSLMWRKKFGRTGYWPDPFLQAMDSGYVFAGSSFDYGSRSDDMIVVKLDKKGEIPFDECDIVIESSDIRLADIAYTQETGSPAVLDNDLPHFSCGVEVGTADVAAQAADLDFYPICDPVLIELSSLTAAPADRSVLVEWSTASEIYTQGFNIYRAATADGSYEKINEQLIAARGGPVSGAAYRFLDSGRTNGVAYYYMIEDVDLYGISTFHGPVTATPRLIYRLTAR